MFTESQIAALIRHGMEAVPALPDPPDWGTAMRLRDVYAGWAEEVRGMLYGDYGFDLHESYRARLDQHGTPTPAVFMEPSAAAPVLTALATHYGQHVRFYHDHACRMRPPHPYTPAELPALREYHPRRDPVGTEWKY